MHFSPSFAFYFCFTFKFPLFLIPLYFCFIFFIFSSFFSCIFFIFSSFFSCIFSFFLFFVQFFCFFRPFSTFLFLHSPLFLRVPLYLVALYFCFSFQFNSCLSVALYPCFIYLRFTSASSHFFLLLFPLLLCLTAIPFQLLLSSSTFFLPLSSRPASTLSFRLHYSNTPTFTLHSHPSPPPAPHPAPNKACRGGTAAPPLSALQCGGRSPGGSSAPLRPPQQRSAAPPPGPPPRAWSRCRPPRATNRRRRSRAGFSARRGRSDSCCSVFLPTPFLLLLLPAGGV